jgi:hypothetical protein
METDVVLLLILTLIGHSTVAYTTVWYIFKRKGNELKAATSPENMVRMIKQMLQTREQENGPTFLEEVMGALGQYLGRYLAGMMGRGTRSANAMVLDAAGDANPLIASLLKIPGARKIVGHPLFQEYVLPAIMKNMPQQPSSEVPE